MMTPTRPPERPDSPLSASQRDCVLHGDCLDVLRSLPDACVDAIVTDPPAGIAFMGKQWDNPDYFPMRDRGALNGTPEHAAHKHGRGFANGMTYDKSRAGRDAFIAFMTDVFTECLRVLKPGGHALVWALPRTSHWTATALEDAGFEIRDRVSHIFGSGFPKSLDVSKQIDKQAGAKRKVTGRAPDWKVSRKWRESEGRTDLPTSLLDITAPATPAAAQWDGWGTALKPAVEDWWLVRKPLAEANVASNVLRHGVGALNIGQSRVEGQAQRPFGVRRTPPAQNTYGRAAWHDGHGHDATDFEPHPAGRWPSHLLLSHSVWCAPQGCVDGCPVAELDAQSGIRTSGLLKAGTKRSTGGGYMGHMPPIISGTYGGDTGGASRYFTTFRYQAKASRRDRSSNGAVNNTHPTCKPQPLMEYLIKLITPPGGIVLDPFLGSGSTAVACVATGFHFIGIERELEYVNIARARIAAVEQPVSLGSAVALEQPKPVKRQPRKRTRKTPPASALWSEAAV